MAAQRDRRRVRVDGGAVRMIACEMQSYISDVPVLRPVVV